MHRSVLLDAIEELPLPSLVEQQEDLPTWLTNEVTVHNTADPEDGSLRFGAQSRFVSTMPYTWSPLPTRGSAAFTQSLTSAIYSSLMSSGSSTTSSKSQCSFLQVKWTDWGPPISRWFQVKAIQAQFITSFGQRCAFLFPNPRDRRKTMVSVVDFNPHNLRRNAEMEMRLRGGEGEDNGGNGNNEEGKEEEEEDELELLDHEGVFSEEVYMGLKGVVYHAPDEYDFNQLLMDEERLLGLKLDRKQNVESVKVLYFG
ncbi:hypothetical protein M378DRAFT_11846 [Amanita muscaria Koide BX008]|uniref:Uncharacterized protein n=1 Tax=Amanita muscaria (strain Koide BX008) TaxID=946122 RepID=A0A0C2TB44_AMAMK|nr:hypothetical protein M378DRAFT_11846 [Amanita muscaria Koide BX008]